MAGPSAAPHPSVAALAREVQQLLLGQERVVVGLAGPPGTGKSTVAAALVTHLAATGTGTVLVPMDGFHLDQLELERLGRAARKGAPDTFDAGGYVALLRRLRERTEPVTYAPRFDRGLEQSVGSALPVPASTPVVVTEGNYLLLGSADLVVPRRADRAVDTGAGPDAVTPDPRAWDQVRPLLDRCWFVDTADAVRLERLVARHVAHGRSEADARAWVAGNDEVNARLVLSTRDRADGTVTWD